MNFEYILLKSEPKQTNHQILVFLDEMIKIQSSFAEQLLLSWTDCPPPFLSFRADIIVCY